MGILARGLITVLAVAALLAAGELTFCPDTEILPAAAGLSALSAFVLLLVQHLYFSGLSRIRRHQTHTEAALEEVAGLQRQVRALENDRKKLRQQVESLTAQRELNRAASQHTSLEDFLDEVAGVVHDLAGARSLTVFLTDAAATGPVPRAYYSICRASELCLSIDEAGGVMLMEDMDPDNEDQGRIDAELLAARRLNVTPRGVQAVVSGNLTYAGADIGLIRLALHRVDPDNIPTIETIQHLVAGELGRVHLDSRHVLESMLHQRPMRFAHKRQLFDLTAPMVIDQDPAGAVKVCFDCRNEEDIEETLTDRSRLLMESAKHIARAVRSERIYEQAIKDQLTGLYNKRYMMTQLEGYFHVACRHQTHLSMILIDIDHFKNVNDTWGHLTGDMILRDVAAILMEGVRSCDTACRYGGEELAVILPEGSLEGSVGLADRLRSAIEEREFVSDKGETLHCTASFGVAEVNSGMRRIEDLIAHADAALYESKEGGRNRVTAWQPPADLELSQESTMVQK